MPIIKCNFTDQLPITTPQYVQEGGFVVLTYHAGLAYQQIFRRIVTCCAYKYTNACHPSVEWQHRTGTETLALHCRQRALPEPLKEKRMDTECVEAQQQGAVVKRLTWQYCNKALSWREWRETVKVPSQNNAAVITVELYNRRWVSSCLY
jgi:hypothetical protein